MGFFFAEHDYFRFLKLNEFLRYYLFRGRRDACTFLIRLDYVLLGISQLFENLLYAFIPNNMLTLIYFG